MSVCWLDRDYASCQVVIWEPELHLLLCLVELPRAMMCLRVYQAAAEPRQSAGGVSYSELTSVPDINKCNIANSLSVSEPLLLLLDLSRHACICIGMPRSRIYATQLPFAL